MNHIYKYHFTVLYIVNVVGVRSVLYTFQSNDPIFYQKSPLFTELAKLDVICSFITVSVTED